MVGGGINRGVLAAAPRRPAHTCAGAPAMAAVVAHITFRAIESLPSDVAPFRIPDHLG